VKCLTSATLLATGDVIAQTAVERKPVREFDVVRMGRMAAIGAMVAGPLSTGWYQFLDRLKFGGMSVNGAVLAKTALDQSIFGPTINSAFFTTNVLLNGGSVSDGELKQLVFPLPPRLLGVG
jgi:protein Mpv17